MRVLALALTILGLSAACAHAALIPTPYPGQVQLTDTGVTWLELEQDGSGVSNSVVFSAAAGSPARREFAFVPSRAGCTSATLVASGARAALLSMERPDITTGCGEPASRVIRARSADGTWTELAREPGDGAPCGIAGIALDGETLVRARRYCAARPLTAAPLGGGDERTIPLPLGMSEVVDEPTARHGFVAATLTGSGGTRIAMLRLADGSVVSNVSASLPGCESTPKPVSLDRDGTALVQCRLPYQGGTYAVMGGALLAPGALALTPLAAGRVVALGALDGGRATVRTDATLTLRDLRSDTTIATIDPRPFAPAGLVAGSSPALRADFDGSRLAWARDGGVELEAWPLRRATPIEATPAPTPTPPAAPPASPAITAPPASKPVRTVSGRAAAGTTKVVVALTRERVRGKRRLCEDVTAAGRLRRARRTTEQRCASAVPLTARGTRTWSVRFGRALPPGRYRIVAVAQRSGTSSPAARRTFTVR